MTNKFFSMIFTGFLLLTIVTHPISATAKAIKDTPSPEKIKQKVIKFGVGEKARATVKLKNGTRIKGYISQASENDFTVRDAKTDAPTVVSYGDVEKIKGHNLSTGAKIAIGAGIGAAAFLAAVIIAFRSQPGIFGP